MSSEAPLDTPGLTGIQIILTVLYSMGIYSVSNCQCLHVAFKSFDLNLLMAYGAVFSKRVCHQLIYDNWHTATCKNCCSVNSTKKLAQKVSLKHLKPNKLLLSTKGCFPDQWHPYDFIEDSPLMWLGCSSY